MNPFYRFSPEKSSTRIALLMLFLLTYASAFSQTYNWKPVQIKGGGFISGFIYSKADPNLLFNRTDVGGAYRWNQSTKTWTPLTDGMLNSNDWGVWSMAADPTNANNVYMATGLYSESWGQNGIIYKSTDKGNTWTNISNLPFKLGGNNPARGSGERLVIDPNKPSVLFLGSKKDGLYKSTDSGVNWTKVTSLNASYITFVEFDKSTGTTGNNTQNIYVGVADNIYNGGNVGVYRSTDGGTTWNKLTNHPTQLAPKNFAPGDAALTTVPSDMYITTGNTIYFTFSNTVSPDGDYTLPEIHRTISNGAVYKFDKSTNAWTNITPSGSNGMQGGFSSISVSATNASKIAIATIGRWWPHDEVYFSSDAGANWASTFNSYSYASTWGNSLNKGVVSTTKAPYAGQSTIGWPSSIEISPTNDNQVMISSGGGVFACYDVSALFTNATSGNTASTTWIYENDGIEETVPLEIVSPPSGAPLVSAIGDIDGFVHSNLDASPSQGKHGIVGGTHSGTTRSIAFAENLPTKMVRAYDNDTYNKGAYSTDGGLTWTRFATKPTGVNSNDGSGKIAISTDGNRIVWSSVNATIAYSSNNGTSWTASTGGVPNGLKPVADRVNKDKFYVFDGSSQKLYYSTDGGASFSNVTLTGTTGVPNYEEYQPEVCAALANEGHLWLANQNNGIYRSTNGGVTWTKVTTVTSAIRVTTGKSVTATGYPAVFIWGVVGGVNGLFRSDDQGATWERLNNASTEWARNPTTISGDPRIYGRVYVGLGGRGIIYGDRTTATCTATITSPSTSICPTGSVVLTASTGTSYKWYKDAAAITGATNATYSAIAAGSYTVEVTNASGCSATSAATAITGTAQATPTITSPSTSICPAGSVVLTSSTGTSYKWFKDAAAITTATNVTYSAIAAGSYTVEVTNASGCKATSVATVITGTAQATPTITATANSICPTGSATLTSSAGTAYKWFKDAAVISTATNATYAATASGSYTVEVTNASGCAATSAAMIITGTAQATPTITSTSTSICPTGSVTLTSSAGTSYKWFKDAAAITSATNATYAATASGSYTVEVTNASGCKATSVATVITGTAQATPTITSTTNSICPSGSVTLTSSTGTSYKWFKDAAAITSATNATYAATASGSYTVEVTNASGCKATSVATIITGTIQATPTITSASTSICPTGSAVLTASTGASYKWYKDAAPIGGATNVTYTATASGSYTVEVTNASGCFAISAATAITGTAQATPTITATANSICPTGSVTLTSSAGTSYKWFKDAAAITTATNATYAATASGSYTVEVTNASGCKATSAAMIITGTAQATPTITSPSTSICPTGSVVLTASAGASYKWYKDAAPIGGATNLTYTATASGSYTVEVTNASGCFAISAATAITGTAQATPTIASTANSICPTGSVTLTSSAGTSYKWFKDAAAISTATNATYAATASGSYTVEVTNASGCKATSAAMIITGTAQATPTITSPGTSFCTGGSITLTASAGASYKWYKDAAPIGAATNATYSATAAGSYTVEVTNASGCSAISAATTITVTASQTATISSAANSFCAGGSILLSANTGSGLTYVWSNTAGTISGATNATYTATAASTYTVTVSNGTCTGTSAGKVITTNAVPAATITAGSATTFCSGGSVILSANTGSSLTYQWSNAAGTIASATNATYTATAAGTYTVTVSNTNCSATSTGITITVNALPTATITAPVTSFCTGGSVLLSANAGSGLTYQWSNTSGTIASATNVNYTATAAGTYTVKVTNTATTCSATSAGTTVTVTASITWYLDSDGDSKGDPNATTTSCTQPTGYVSVAGDACPTDPAKIAAGNCGCGNTEQSCLDCAGVPNGGAYFDNCSICVGGNTGNTPCTSTATINGTSINIKVVPQPFQTATTIKLENLGTIKSITIVNAAGALIEQKDNINATEITLGESLASGMYSVIIHTENQVYTTKIIKF